MKWLCITQLFITKGQNRKGKYIELCIKQIKNASYIGQERER